MLSLSGTSTGVPAASVKNSLSNLQHDSDTVVGVFGSGKGATTPDDIAAIKDDVPALQRGAHYPTL